MYLRCAVLAALLCGMAAAAGNKNKTSAIYQLTEASFDTFIDDNTDVVVAFTVPWCDYCRTLKPEYETVPALANATMDAGVAFPAVFANVDCEYEPALKERFEIEVFPTFMLFRDGLPERLGNGKAPKTGEGVVAAARSSLGLSPTSYAHLVSGIMETGSWLFYRGWSSLSYQSTVMGFFPPSVEATPASRELRQMFEEAAALMNGEMRFGVTSDPEVIKAYSIPDDEATVFLYKDYDEGKERYTGPVSAVHLKSWVETRNHPLALVVERSTLNKWQNSVDVLVHLFVDERGAKERVSREAYLTALRNVGMALEEEGLSTRGRMLLSVVDAQTHAVWLNDFGLSDAPLPSLGLVDTLNHKFYAYSGGAVGDLGTIGNDEEKPTEGTAPTVDEAAVLTFLQQFFAGLLMPAAEH